MKQEAVADFERGFLDILVRPMGRVAGLEGDDLAPAEFAKAGPRLARFEPILKEGAARNIVDEGDGAAETPGRRRGDVPGAGMGVLGGAEDGLRLAAAIDLEDVGDSLNRQRRAVFGDERDFLAGLERTGKRFLDAEGDRN